MFTPALMLRSTCSLLALGTFSLAGLRAEDALVEVRLPDVSRSVERLRAGIYGQAWMTPEAAKLRAFADLQSSLPMQMLGLPKPLEILAETRRISCNLYAPADDKSPPTGFVQIDGVTVSQAIVKVAQTLGRLEAKPELATGLGAEEVVAGNDLVVARFPQCAMLCPSGYKAQPLPLPKEKSSQDLEFTWNVKAIAAAVAKAGAEKGPALAALVQQLLPNGKLEAQIIEAGFRQRLTLDQSPAIFGGPIDSSVYAHIPASTATFLACNLSLPALWKAHAAGVLKSLQSMPDFPHKGITLAEGVAQIDAMLMAQGIPLTGKDLIGSIDGTFVIGAETGGLFGQYIVMMQRNKNLDNLIDLLLTKSGQKAPNQDEVTFISIPLPPGSDLNLKKVSPGICLSRDGAYWYLSTSPLMLKNWMKPSLQNWVSGTGSSLVSSWKDAPFVSWNSGQMERDLLITALPFIGIGMDQVAAGAFTPEVLHIASTLAGRIGLSTSCGKMTDKGFVFEAQGPLAGFGGIGGATGSLPIMAALLYPTVSIVREQARKTEVANNLRGLVGACIAYSTDYEKAPLDLAAAVKYAEMPTKVLRLPFGDASVEPQLLYVRPTMASSSSMQIMILTNPAVTGKFSILAFADGHTAICKMPKAQLIWNVAVKLASLPKAVDTGISLDDWKQELENVGINVFKDL